DEAAKAYLIQGGKVLFLPPAQSVKVTSVIGFSSIFWNTAWTGNQEPHTLGILCNPQHPVFASFPTEYHSNWQWWELISNAAAVPMDVFPPELRPLVQPIDTWFENRRLGLLFEAAVGAGKLMVCSMDLETDLEQRRVARQMRLSVIRYMQSAAFDPAVSLEVNKLQEVISRP
ncbi:MAG: glycoside hydrolase, partial [Anaerolineales bacterium]